MNGSVLRSSRLIASLVLILLVSVTSKPVERYSDRLRGTLVVTVPISNGLVTCADKRLFNVEAGTYTDDNIKIRKVNDRALFVATSTVGFYDRKNRSMAFDAFAVVERFATRNSFQDSSAFWDGLKKEIREQLRLYFSTHSYAEWPETDFANNKLLFNLIFYSLIDGRARGHTVQVFYEKKRSPVVNVIGPTPEDVRSPRLTGKGKELIAFLARNPMLAADPSIAKFDAGQFDIARTSATDVVNFSRTLFRIANTGIPSAQISASFDCAELSQQQPFRWVEGGPAR
jgi:hypothetical protein